MSLNETLKVNGINYLAYNSFLKLQTILTIDGVWEFFLKERNINIKMSGSFGISFFPRDGDTVEELIKKSDSAMYEVKRKVKDGIKIYEGD